LISIVTKDQEENKMDLLESQELASVAKGLIDLKEYAPHILEQSKQNAIGRSLNGAATTTSSAASNANKDREVVNMIQQIYK
jgi:hypothetical protein